MGMTDKEREGGVATHPRDRVAEPPLFKVLLHNDDYTTMEFVIMILENVFHKQQEEASQIMLNVHKQGIGVAGVYSRDIAETKMAMVHDMARKNEHPLKCSLEQV